MTRGTFAISGFWAGGRGAYIVSYFGMTRGTFAISGFSAGGRGAYIVSYFGMTRGTFAISGFSAGGRGAYIVSYFGMTRGTFAISGFSAGGRGWGVGVSFSICSTLPLPVHCYTVVLLSHIFLGLQCSGWLYCEMTRGTFGWFSSGFTAMGEGVGGGGWGGSSPTSAAPYSCLFTATL